jgi:arylsulfatase
MLLKKFSLRQLSTLYLIIVGPLVAASTIGGLINGWLYVSANNYFDERLHYVAIQFIRTQVNRDLIFTLLTSSFLFAVTALLLKGEHRRRFFPYLYVLQLCVLASRLFFSNEWSVTTPLFGLSLPGFLWRRWLIWWSIAALALTFLLLAILTKLWKGRVAGRWPAGWFVRACGWMFLSALGTSAAANLASLAVQPDRATRPFNVIWITWDSVRADHVSCYGYPRPTTPNLDGLAREAVLFEKAIAQHNWTYPSYASMFTSMGIWEFPSRRLSLQLHTLAELLRNHGYRTVGFVQNWNLDGQFHFNQGFNAYFELPNRASPNLVNHFALRTINKLSQRQEPFFLFLHYEQPHFPAASRAPLIESLAGRSKSPFQSEFVRSPFPLLDEDEIYRLMYSNGKGWNPKAPDAEKKLQYLVDFYDANIRYTDEALGEVLDALKKRGVFDNSLIIVNSDHGEEFADHGKFGHGSRNLHPEVTVVPLVIRFPASMSIAPTRVAVPVQGLDIFPTVLTTVGIPLPQYISGRSLVPIEQIGSRERLAFSSAGKLVAVRSRRYALFVDYASKSPPRFFDLANDPQERSPLLHFEQKPAFLQMKAMADLWYERYGASTGAEHEKPKVSRELLERLKSLGYMQ